MTTELLLIALGISLTVLGLTFSGWTALAITLVGCALVFAAIFLQRRRFG